MLPPVEISGRADKLTHDCNPPVARQLGSSRVALRLTGTGEMHRSVGAPHRTGASTVSAHRLPTATHAHSAALGPTQYLVLACVPAEQVKARRDHLDAAELGAHHQPRHVAVELRACSSTEREGAKPQRGFDHQGSPQARTRETLRNAHAQQDPALLKSPPRVVWVHALQGASN
jgi:hypothetical protein